MGHLLHQSKFKASSCNGYDLIAYDGDRAGLEATNRAIEMIQSTNAFTIGIIPFDNGLDPDEFIKQRGPQAFIDLVEHGQETIYQFKRDSFLRNINCKLRESKDSVYRRDDY